MLNLVQKDHTVVKKDAATAAKTAGQLDNIGQIVGVVVASAAIGEPYALDIKGIYEVPCASAADIGEGDAVYFDVADGEINLDNTNILAGYAVEAAGVGVTTVKLLLK